MTTYEGLNDFHWEENKEFADIICEGLKTKDIEYFEALAEAGFIDAQS